MIIAPYAIYIHGLKWAKAGELLKYYVSGEGDSDELQITKTLDPQLDGYPKKLHFEK